MDALLNWIMTNPVMAIVLLVVTIAVIVWVVKHRKGLLRKMALYAVSVAEEEWGSKTGQIKFAEVYSTLKLKFPIITLFFTEKQMKDLIENALQELKTILAEKEAIETEKETTEETE